MFRFVALCVLVFVIVGGCGVCAMLWLCAIECCRVHVVVVCCFEVLLCLLVCAIVLCWCGLR